MIKKFLLLLILFLAVGFVLSLPRIIKIREVVCLSQYGECSEIIQKELSKEKGKSYYASKRNIKAHLESHVLVKEYTISFKLPPRIEVKLLLQKPKFAIVKKDDKLISLVWEEGEILEIVQISSLPRLVIEETPPDIGKKVSPKILFSLNIVLELTNDIKLTSSFMEGEKLVIEVDGGPTVIFPVEGDRDLLLGSFVLITNELKKSGSETSFPDVSKKVVDLRFKNPVIK